MKKFRIGYDIDGVLADFNMAWHVLYPETNPRPNTWFFDDKICERFEKMRRDNTLDDFYLKIKRLIEPEEIKFKPDCYITSRPVDSQISQTWINKNGFPQKQVFTVDVDSSKVEIAKKLNLDLFVDDKYENFLELNENGILCYLFDTPWNREYDVGDLRIHDLNLPILKQ